MRDISHEFHNAQVFKSISHGPGKKMERKQGRARIGREWMERKVKGGRVLLPVFLPWLWPAFLVFQALIQIHQRLYFLIKHFTNFWGVPRTHPNWGGDTPPKNLLLGGVHAINARHLWPALARIVMIYLPSSPNNYHFHPTVGKVDETIVCSRLTRGHL